MTDRRSPEALAWRKLYSTKAWRSLRASHLASEPLCRFCLDVSRVTVGRVVDHIEPHKGDVGRFFDPLNVQTLCTVHHNSSKQREERTGRKVQAIALDGWPVD